MGLRVIVTLLVTFAGIIGSISNAFYGLLGYIFWSYTRPELATWGTLPVRNLSYFMGAVLVITTLIQKNRLFSDNRKNTLLILFWFLALVAVITSGPTELARWQFQFFTRVILITLIITLLVDDLKKYKYFLWAIAIFIGLVAAQSGIKGTLAGQIGSAHKGFEGVFGERSYAAVFLCVTIPIVFYMGNIERDKRLKALLRIILLGDLLALMLTYARAGFLGLVGVALFAFTKSQHKVRFGAALAVSVFIAMNYVVHPAYVERIQTIKNIDIKKGDVDLSAANRLMVWRSTLEMIKERPLFGVGFYNAEAVMAQYPDPETGIALPGKAIHNSLLQVAAYMGLPALLLYVAIFSTIYRILGKIKSKVKQYQLSGEIEYYASMLQVAFIGFFVSGFFVNAAFLDISWHLAGLTIALEQIADKEINKWRMGEEDSDAFVRRLSV